MASDHPDYGKDDRRRRRPVMPAPPTPPREHPHADSWDNTRQWLHQIRDGLALYCDELIDYCQDVAAFSPGLDEQTAEFRWRLATWLFYSVVGHPTHIALSIPQVSRKGQTMPNFEVMNDAVYTVTIKTTNSAGTVEPTPAGDVFTAVSSNPASLRVAVGTDAAGNPAVVMTPLVQASPGLTVTVSDSSGLAQFVQIVDIVADVADTNIILDVADATHVSQPVPTAPGP